MRRRQLIQITSQPWFPRFLKECVFEFLTWFVNRVNAAAPFLPIVEKALCYSSDMIAVEGCNGAGFETLEPLLPDHVNVHKFGLKNFSVTEKGIYTFVNHFHQLSVDEARGTLQSIVDRNQSVLVLEGNNDSLWQAFGMTIIVPLTVLLTAPFVRPFRIERIIFSYLIPILPLVTLYDGFIALFKLYNPQDLMELVSPLERPGYKWNAGKLENGRGGKIIYLHGHPINQNQVGS